MGLIDRMKSASIGTGTSSGSPNPETSKLFKDEAMFKKIKKSVHQKVVGKMNPGAFAGSVEAEEELLRLINVTFITVLEEHNIVLSSRDREKLSYDLLNDVLGLGPIEPLIQDPTVSEIMVNGPHLIYVERKGRIEKTGLNFHDNEHVLRIIEKIVAPIGRHIDEGSPMVDARLKDGSRVNAIIPPLSLTGPVLTIRKFAVDPFTADDLVEMGTFSPEMRDLLDGCVKARLNMVISGGTGSGKTTTLNVLSSFIPDDERIITIEDAAEMQLRQEHVITLESRPSNVEGKGAVSTRDLVKNALRMRPDRIIVGEVRGGECLDMLQAMNTGHEGSLTSAHANSPRDALSRLETMVLMSGMELPIKAVRDQISSALDVVIQQERMKDGTRRITNIVEVLGMESDTIILQDIMKFERTGVDEDGNIKGALMSTGIVPKFVEKFKSYGIKVPMSIFTPGNSRFPAFSKGKIGKNGQKLGDH